jgi:hypothetical protein
MKDTRTMAYINLYGVLAGLEDLCRLSPEAGELACAAPGGRPVSVGFTVRNGPAMTLAFAGKDGTGTCRPEPGEGPCDIKLAFGSAEKFNGMVDGTFTPIPRKGFTKLRFLTRNFIRMTGILESYLRADREKLRDPVFFRASTTIMFFLISRAIAQIANHDSIGRFTASNIGDCTVVLSIADKDGGPLQAALVVKDHVFTASRIIPASYHALMEFSSMELARRLFDGEISALGSVGQGLITMRGNLGVLDNVNRILDRVALYLA